MFNEAMSDTGPTAGWFACYTRGRHEKRAAAVLEERGFEVFLPLLVRTSQWKDRRKVISVPAFPSYVFCRAALVQLHEILAVPGIASVVRAGHRPVLVAEEDIENVRRLLRALEGGAEAPAPTPFLGAGEKVEIMSGPFAGIRGVVVEQHKRKRVLVGLEAIGQAMELDVDVSSLRVLGADEPG
jgi:transcription antitermination factor NusG